MPTSPDYAIAKYKAPASQNWLGHISAGPPGDDRMWFTAFNAGIGSIDAAATPPNPQPANVVNVSCAGIVPFEDQLWFTQTYAKLHPGMGPSITGINTDGSHFATYSLPHDPTVDEYIVGEGKIRWLWALTVADNGCLYFTERHAGRVGCFKPGPSPSPCGAKSELPADWAIVPIGDPVESDPTDIVQGADGNLYYTDYQREKIGCLTPSGTIVAEWPAPGRPWSLTAGPDGHIWYTASEGDYLGRLNLDARTIDRTVSLSGGSQPWQITSGLPGDSTLWFTLRGTNQIGSLRLVEFYPYPPQIVELDTFHYPSSKTKPPSGIALGRNGQVWYTAEDHLGVLTPKA